MRKMDVLGLALVSLSTRFSLTNSLHLLPLSMQGILFWQKTVKLLKVWQ
jgi:hypothetical protein